MLRLLPLICFTFYNVILLDVYMCPSGWTRLGRQSCFRRFDAVFKTWHESLHDCEKSSSNEGSLASIQSVQEMNRLSVLFTEKETWIGLNDIDSEGKYSWTDGSPFVYATWGPSEAKKIKFERERQDCVASTKNLWNSDHCLAKKPSLCLMPARLGT